MLGRRTAWVGGLMVLVLTSPVLALDEWKPPGKDKGILQWVIMLGIFILICIPGFMNPKRSHMD